MRLGKRLAGHTRGRKGTYKIYGYIFDCDVFIYKNREITGVLYEIKTNSTMPEWKFEDAVSVHFSRTGGLTIRLDHRVRHIRVEPYKIYLLAKYENYEEPIEITEEILFEHLEEAIDHGYYDDTESRSFIDHCRISGWRERLMERVGEHEIVRKKIYRLYGYMFDCDTFMYDGHTITGLCCEIRTASAVPQDELDGYVRIRLTKEEGFSIFINCSAKNIFVEPYKIYFLAQDECSGIEEPIEVGHDVLLKYREHIIESPERCCAESSSLVYIR